MARTKKRTRNANGEGTIYHLGGKSRSRPWVAKIPEGIEFDPHLKKGYRQKYKTIGYYETEKEAKIALLEFQINPTHFNHVKKTQSIKFKDVYEMWLPIAARKKTNKTLGGYKAGFKNASKIHDIPIQNLKTAHYQMVLDECKLSPSSKIKLRSLLIAVNKYAVQEDILEKNYAAFTIPITDVKSKMHKPFTNDEIKTLWDNIDLPYVDTILIMIYSGYRINELLNLICGVNVDLDKNIFIGGFKTKAGKNRIVPIHHKILPYIQTRYESGLPLIRTSRSNSKMKYQNYRNNYFDKIMRKLKMDHLPHDCRHTFATLLNNVNANNITVTKLIGRKSFDTTERVYIHKNIEQLRETIEKIPV